MLRNDAEAYRNQLRGGPTRGCPFLDEDTVAETFATDGVVLEAPNTRIMSATITDLKKTRLI